MATLPRSAKSGNEWTRNELKAYNIRVVEEPSEVFFGRQLPDVNELDVDPDLFIPFDANGVLTRRPNEYRVRSFLRSLSVAENLRYETYVDEYAQNLLKALDFDEDDDVIVVLRTPLNFFTCGDNRQAQPDVCLQSLDGTIFFLVQGDKTTISRSDPEAQLIAEAIAAVVRNNYHRKWHLGLPDKDLTIPAIAMIGTNMAFYKIPVSGNLVDAVESGTYPAQETVVKRCMPVANFQSMKDVETRRIVISHCLLFRNVVREFMQDVPR